jgi:hypothetical protein
VSASDAPPEWTAFTDEVLLPDELVEISRTHPCRQGLPLGWRLEERFGSGTEGSPGGRHAPMVARRLARAERVGPGREAENLERDPGDLGHDPQGEEQADE